MIYPSRILFSQQSPLPKAQAKKQQSKLTNALTQTPTLSPGLNFSTNAFPIPLPGRISWTSPGRHSTLCTISCDLAQTFDWMCQMTVSSRLDAEHGTSA